MKATLRNSEDRGKTALGWLDSRHSFSFGDYYDPERMGFGPLRVINEDRVLPGSGFPAHPHRDMEIISYVLEGVLEHKDSTGVGSVIHPGEAQRMSAGTGIRHSEFNASRTAPVHFLQIRIIPERKGLEPAYEQKDFAADEKSAKLRLIGSRDGRAGSVTIHQDVNLYATLLKRGESVSHVLATDRLAWIQVARGSIRLNDELLQTGDGLAVESEGELRLEGRSSAEFLLFDMSH